MPGLFTTLLLACCGYALARGGRPEKLCAMMMLVATAFTMAIFPEVKGRFAELEVGLFAADLVLLLAFVGLALAADRYWPMWISSMQLVAVMSHVVGAILGERVPLAYAVAVVLWSYPMVVMLALATYRHHVRVRRDGPEQGWSQAT